MRLYDVKNFRGNRGAAYVIAQDEDQVRALQRQISHRERELEIADITDQHLGGYNGLRELLESGRTGVITLTNGWCRAQWDFAP